MKFNYFSHSMIAVAMCVSSHGETVTNTLDNGPGSLRFLLAAAASGEVIEFAPALDGATITLTSGSLEISRRAISISATALPKGISISGNANSRVFTIMDNSSVNLDNLHIRDGRAADQVGGGMAVFLSQLKIENCSIVNCSGNTDGGGFWGNSVTGSMNRCKIEGNLAGNFGGGIFLIGVSSFEINNSVVSGNKSLIGGGVFNLYASPMVTNCTVQGNSGSGIRSENSSDPILRNCVVWGNRAPSGTKAAMQLSNFTDSNPNVAHCLIEGASGSASFADGDSVVWGSNNLDGTLVSSDPLFVHAANPASAPTTTGDSRVYLESPTFNAGDSAANGNLLDLAGKPRLQGSTIDLGAYEGGYVNFALLYPALSPTGDANANGRSNFLDYALGVDPAGISATSTQPAITSSGSLLLLTFTQRSNSVDIDSDWETSTGLNADSWIPLVRGTHYSNETEAYPAPDRSQSILTLLPGGTSRFYRQRFSQRN